MRYGRNCHILTIRALAVTLTMKIANDPFCMTLQLIVMPHNTEFGNKMFGGLKKKIIWMNIDNLTFAVTLTLTAIIQFLHKTLSPMITCHQTNFGSQRISSSEDVEVRVIF